MIMDHRKLLFSDDDLQSVIRVKLVRNSRLMENHKVTIYLYLTSWFYHNYCLILNILALIATTIVLTLISTAPIAGLSIMPAL